MAGFGGKTHFKKGGNFREQRTIVPKEERTSPDGIVHRTRAECKRWNSLRLLEQHGHIRNLRREVPYPLDVILSKATSGQDCIRVTVKSRGTEKRNGIVRRYTADFVYETRSQNRPAVERRDRGDGWWEVIEDIKGFLDPAQELRLDVFEALYGVRVFINKA
jgi:hypothetical protein